MEKSPLLLKNVVHNGHTCDILIENGVFRKIDSCIIPSAECRVIDFKGNFAISPAFYNTHTHAAMSLMRSYADDMELFKWLNDYVWKFEAKLSPHDIYIGSKLAMLEMIRTGTVFFNDMYWYPMETVKAVKDMKMRAAVGMLYLSGSDAELEEKNNAINQELEEKRSTTTASLFAINYMLDTSVKDEGQIFDEPIYGEWDWSIRGVGRLLYQRAHDHGGTPRRKDSGLRQDIHRHFRGLQAGFCTRVQEPQCPQFPHRKEPRQGHGG